MQRRDLQAAVERRSQHGIDLIFEQHDVAHDFGVCAGPGKGRPRGQPQVGIHVHAGHRHGQVAPGQGDPEHPRLVVECALQAGELLDAGGVQRGANRLIGGDRFERQECAGSNSQH